MDFGILGPLQALEEGRAVALGGSKQKALLAVLLLHANETLSTEQVIDELWGERPPATAAKTVQVHVSRLRKALAAGNGGADDVVLTRERGYELRLDPGRLDAHRFERLVAEGRRELVAGRPERAVALVEEALGLWRGRPLADLSYEAFAQREISRLEDLRVAATEQLIEAKLALGRHDEVVEQLEALVAEHPYRERFRAQLMLALYRCDRQADALQAYQDARRQLVEELGIEPGERLRELEGAILAQDPALALVVEQPAPERRAAGSTRGGLVGRKAELDELEAALDDALAGRGRLVLLAGEPGIGKSRLADEAMGAARARGARIAVGRCWEAGGAPAYWPWVQALPELRELLGDVAVRESDSGGARFELFESIAALIRSAAAARPLAVFLDDLHAADAPSLLLCRFVAEQIADAAVLMVASYRDTEVGPDLAEALPELDRTATVRRLRLKGLGREDTAQLLELATGEPLPDALAEKVHSETEGNPLFAGEVGRLLATEGVGGKGDRLPVPEGAREAIGRRLTQLSESCRDVMGLASVIGREFEPATLEIVSGLEQDELFAALEEAIAARLVGELPEGGTLLRFSHMLVRDAVYESLPAPRRPGLHARVGVALEQRYGANTEPHSAELAHHYLLAGHTSAAKALVHATAAGDRAASLLAYEEAARHYRSALGMLGAGDQERCALLLRLGDALSRAGDDTEAKETFRVAAELAEQMGRADWLARAALGYAGRFGWERASTQPALVPLLRRALSAIGDGDPLTRVKLLARLAAALRDDVSSDRRTALAEEAMRIAEARGDPATIAYASSGLLVAIEGPKYAETGVVAAKRLIALGEELGDRELVFLGHDYGMNSSLQLADRAAVDVEAEALTTIAEELRQPAQLWSAGTVRTRMAMLEGRFEEAERLIEETLARGRVAAGWNATVSRKMQLFVLRRAQGRLAEVEEMIARAVHEYPTLFRFRCLMAHVHAEVGHERAAREALDELFSHDLSAEYVDAEWLFSMVVLADPCAAFGDEVARKTLHELMAPGPALYAQAPVEATFGSVARALGVLDRSLGRFEDAERHFESALEIERRMRARPWLAHAQHDFAAMLLARGAEGDQPRARQLASEAIAAYRDLGMTVWAERAEALG